MFDKFCDYMYYLLTSPFKRVKKKLNQWYILFKVLGRRFDDAMESLYDAREQTMLATCDPVMLQVHADDRKMSQYPGEDNENFRARIANYSEVLRLGGSDPGVLLAVRVLGFAKADIKLAKYFKNDVNRWAEFYVLIWLDADEDLPIEYAVLRKEVRRTKLVSAKDNYQIAVKLENDNNIYPEVYRNIVNMQNELSVLTAERCVIQSSVVNEPNGEMRVEIKNNLWHFDGTYRFNGEKILNAYWIREEL